MKVDKEWFRKLRFDKNHHLGLGDIRLTIGQQEEILSRIKAIEEERDRLREKYRKLENTYVQEGAIYEGISDILRDGKTSDFMLSFPIVSKILDLYNRACCYPSNEWGHTANCVREERDDLLGRLKIANETLIYAAKYKAFWEQSRMVDQYNFEEYVWKGERS